MEEFLESNMCSLVFYQLDANESDLGRWKLHQTDMWASLWNLYLMWEIPDYCGYYPWAVGSGSYNV